MVNVSMTTDTYKKLRDKKIVISNTEEFAIRKEMTLSEIQALPGFTGILATQSCVMHGEYKYKQMYSDGRETEFIHIVMIEG